MEAGMEKACTWRYYQHGCKNEGGVWFDADGIAYRICEECAEREGLLSADPLAGQTLRDYEPGDEVSWLERRP
jgi:hypothetical protein